MQMGRSVPMYVVYCCLFVLLALLTSCICYTHMRVTAHGLARIHCWASPRTPSTEILAEWCLVQGAAWASRHSMICRRKTWFGKSSKLLSGAPVLGLVRFLVPSQSSMAPFSYVCPSAAQTGSSISSREIGQTNSSGGWDVSDSGAGGGGADGAALFRVAFCAAGGGAGGCGSGASSGRGCVQACFP